MWTNLSNTPAAYGNHYGCQISHSPVNNGCMMHGVQQYFSVGARSVPFTCEQTCQAHLLLSGIIMGARSHTHLWTMVVWCTVCSNILVLVLDMYLYMWTSLSGAPAAYGNHFGWSSQIYTNLSTMIMWMKFPSAPATKRTCSGCQICTNLWVRLNECECQICTNLRVRLNECECQICTLMQTEGSCLCCL